MTKIKKTKPTNTILMEYQPEIGLLRLATKGVATSPPPTDDDFKSIANSLNNKQMVILFKQFWKHTDVVNLTSYLTSHVSVDGLIWYLSELSKIIAVRNELHWIERINLFHVYGLSRLFGKQIDPIVISSFPLFSRKSHLIESLADLSAYNVLLMLKEASANESVDVINSIAERPLLAEYGMYQIYYYQGISELIGVLKKYVGSNKESIIPQTIAGMFEAEPRSLILTKSMREIIYDEIIGYLPSEVGLKLETLDKRNAHSFKSTF